MELVVEDIKPTIEMSKQVTTDPMTSSDQVASSLEEDDISENPKNKMTDCVDQQMQAKKKIGDFNTVSKQIEHLMDLIVMPLLETQTMALKETYIVMEVVEEDQVIEVPHVDFIFGDRQLIFEDC